MNLIILIGVFLVITEMSAAFAQEESSIFIYKSISETNIGWSDEVEIKIIISNIGNKQISDVKITDTIPFGFKLIPTNGVAMENEYLVFHADDLQQVKEKEFSYKIKPIEGMKGEKSISTNLPRAKVSYVTENITYTKESNSLQITLKQSNEWWQENIATTVALLIAISFGFGAFGTVIHNQNLNFAKKNENISKPNEKEVSKAAVSSSKQENQTKEQNLDDKTEKSNYPPLIGGVAGIVVLASFEGLSSLFANGQLQPTVQNMIVLIATSLASGFTPVAVIDKMTSKFKTEAESAKEQKNLLEQRNNEIKEQKKGIEAKNKEIEDKNKEIEDKSREIQANNEELKRKETDKTINRDELLTTIHQLNTDLDIMRKSLFQLKKENDDLKKKNDESHSTKRKGRTR